MASTTSGLEQYYDAYERVEEAFQKALDESLHPRGPDYLYELVAGFGLPKGSGVLDLGCGEGRHSMRLAEQLGFAVTGVDPVSRHITLAKEALADAVKQNPRLASRVRFAEGTAEAIPMNDSSVELIWCKEALYYFDLDRAFAECLRVLRSGGRMLIYNMFNGKRMEPREAERQWTQDVVLTNADYTLVEAAMERSGLQIEECIVLGGEGGEYSQEQSGEPGRRLLHAARLLREPERYIARFGQANYDIMLGDCFWHIYRMIGKLSARVYVLRAPTSA